MRNEIYLPMGHKKAQWKGGSSPNHLFFLDSSVNNRIRWFPCTLPRFIIFYGYLYSSQEFSLYSFNPNFGFDPHKTMSPSVGSGWHPEAQIIAMTLGEQVPCWKDIFGSHLNMGSGDMDCSLEKKFHFLFMLKLILVSSRKGQCSEC